MPKNRFIADLSEHGTEVRTLEHNDDAKMPGFSVLLENTIVDANPLNALQIDARVTSNLIRNAAIATKAMQYIMYIFKLLIISKTNSNILSISYMLQHHQYFFAS
jgi:hypothetical protein